MPTRQSDADDLSTFRNVSGLGHSDTKRRQWFIGLSRSLLILVPVLAILGVFDVRTASMTSSTPQGDLELIYPRMTRAGQATPLTFRLNSTTPITQPVTIELCGSYFDRLDFQSWYPNPSSETRSGDNLSYKFDPPQARSLVIALDARAAPEAGITPATCEATVETGQLSFTFTFTTWRLL